MTCIGKSGTWRRELIAALFTAAGPACAQPAYEIEWVLQFGSSKDDAALGVGVDGVGGVYLGGITHGSLGGPNGGTSLPTTDRYIARVAGSGELAWIRQFGIDGADGVAAVASTGTGGVFASGFVGGAANVLRQDVAGGHAAWDRQFGTPWADRAQAVVADGADGVFVAGYLHHDWYYAVHSDAFIARFDADGDQVWLRELGSGHDDEATAVCPDRAGGALICGWTTVFAPATGLNADYFVARYSAQGEQAWMRQHGSVLWDEAIAIAADGVGGLFVGGFTTGNLGGMTAGAKDAILARWDGTGKGLWIRHFGTNADDSIEALVPDGAGGVLASGYTGGALAEPAPGGGDVFLARYDASGNRLWIAQVGSAGRDYPHAIAPRGGWGVVVAGETTGSWGAPSAGASDAFAVCLAESCYADCNRNRFLGGGDFACFWNKFVGSDPYTDCTMDGLLTVADWGCFQTKFMMGCD